MQSTFPKIYFMVKIKKPFNFQHLKYLFEMNDHTIPSSSWRKQFSYTSMHFLLCSDSSHVTPSLFNAQKQFLYRNFPKLPFNMVTSTYCSLNNKHKPHSSHICTSISWSLLGWNDLTLLSCIPSRIWLLFSWHS